VGNVLNIGRRSRIIPAGMSRVLSIRDCDFKEGEAVIEANPCCAVHYSNELPWSLCRDIDVNTAVTRWQGERMDLGVAVEGLLVKNGFSL